MGATKPTSHKHEMVFMVKPSEMQDEQSVEEQRPQSPSETMGNGSMNLLTESENRKGDEEMSEDSEIKAEDDLTESSDVSVEKAVEEKSEEVTVTVASEEDITEAEKEEIDDEEEAISADPYEPIPFVNLLSAETSRLTHENFVKFDDKRWKVTKLATA